MKNRILGIQWLDKDMKYRILESGHEKILILVPAKSSPVIHLSLSQTVSNQQDDIPPTAKKIRILRIKELEKDKEYRLQEHKNRIIDGIDHWESPPFTI